MSSADWAQTAVIVIWCWACLALIGVAAAVVSHESAQAARKAEIVNCAGLACSVDGD